MYFAEGSDAALNGGCFPANSTVQLQNGSKIAIKFLSVGDNVLAVDRTTGKLVYSEVLSFLDKQTHRYSSFVEVKSEKETLTLTDSHMLFVAEPSFSFNGFEHQDEQTEQDFWSLAKPIHASQVKKGHYIFVSPPQHMRNRSTTTLSRITSIQHRTMGGTFAPLTKHGTLLVDGAVVSCYGVVNSEPLAHAAFYPARTFKLLTRGDNEGIHWYANTLLLTVRSILPESILSLV